MEFLYSTFLYALALVAVPIIIHLFNFRKFKTVYFSNVQFLKSVKEKTKSQSQLKHLLILLSRILTIAFIVFAFAQPYLKSEESDEVAKKHAVSVYIDNSFSMDAENESGRLLQSAKQQAQSIFDAYSPNDDFYFLENNFKPIHQRKLAKEQLFEEINAIETSSNVHSLNKVFKRQKYSLENSTAEKKDIYIISDFQKTIADLDLEAADSAYSVRLIQANPYENGNVYIDSCWLSKPNPQVQSNISLFARLKADNIEERDVSIKLTVDNQQRAIANTSLQDESIVELNFNINELGWHNGTLSLHDYPITFDDEFHFSFEIKPQINVQHIYDTKAHPSLVKLFDEDDYFNYSSQSVNQINYTDLAQNQLIILEGFERISSGLEQSILNALKDGQSIMLFPSEKMDFESYKSFATALGVDFYKSLEKTESAISKIDYKNALFDGVFEEKEERLNFPKVDSYYSISQLSTTNASSILTLDNKSSFLSEYKVLEGAIYLSAVGLDKSFSNFSKHALFVPVLYNIASYSGGKQRLYYTIGDESIPLINSGFSKPFSIQQGEFECIPNARAKSLFVGNQINTAGHYNLVDNDNSLISRLAFNYDRLESQLNTLEKDDLTALSQRYSNILLIDKNSDSISNYLKTLNTGTPLWIYCIMLALLFLIIETLLIRLLWAFYSNP